MDDNQLTLLILHMVVLYCDTFELCSLIHSQYYLPSLIIGASNLIAKKTSNANCNVRVFVVSVRDEFVHQV
jgi:hypothetical protein